MASSSPAKCTNCEKEEPPATASARSASKASKDNNSLPAPHVKCSKCKKTFCLYCILPDQKETLKTVASYQTVSKLLTQSLPITVHCPTCLMSGPDSSGSVETGLEKEVKLISEKLEKLETFFQLSSTGEKATNPMTFTEAVKKTLPSRVTEFPKNVVRQTLTQQQKEEKRLRTVIISNLGPPTQEEMEEMKSKIEEAVICRQKCQNILAEIRLGHLDLESCRFLGKDRDDSSFGTRIEAVFRDNWSYNLVLSQKSGLRDSTEFKSVFIRAVGTPDQEAEGYKMREATGRLNKDRLGDQWWKRKEEIRDKFQAFELKPGQWKINLIEKNDEGKWERTETLSKERYQTFFPELQAKNGSARGNNA